MEDQTLMVKEKISYLTLLKQLSDTAEETVEEIGKSTQWLQYSAIDWYGYEFFPDCERRWKVLNKIAEKVQKHSKYNFGKISDNLSYLVNTRVIDEICKNRLVLSKEVISKFKTYLMSTLISSKTVDKYIPRHHWLVITKTIDSNTLEVFDLSKNTKLYFSKRIVGNFIIFERKII